MNFIGKLDERYEGKLKKDNVLMARKVRKLVKCLPDVSQAMHQNGL